MIGVLKRRWWNATLIAGLTITAVTIALAAIPDASGVIHACYTSKGTVRVVNSAADCKNNETALPWNQTGPQGIPGPVQPFIDETVTFVTAVFEPIAFTLCNLPDCMLAFAYRPAVSVGHQNHSIMS